MMLKLVDIGKMSGNCRCGGKSSRSCPASYFVHKGASSTRLSREKKVAVICVYPIPLLACAGFLFLWWLAGPLSDHRDTSVPS